MRVAGFALFLSTLIISHFAVAQLSRVEITSRETLSDPSVLLAMKGSKGLCILRLARV